MSKRLDFELFELTSMLANMIAITQSMFADAMLALREQDADLANDVIKRDKTVDRLDLEIDEHCLRILALFDPKAMQLRHVIASLRLIMDIERVADHCKVIAKQVRKHYCTPVVQSLPDLEEMIKLTSNALALAAEAFAEIDVAKAARVAQIDEEVDEVQSRVNRELVLFITANPDKAKLGVAMTNIVRRIARISDHSKNIAEAVHYVLDGTNIRHTESKNEHNTAD
jgi:phosphate transport system protein